MSCYEIRMDIAPAKVWTQQEFFDWAQQQALRYEFDGVEPVAMTGGNAGHSRVIRNLHRTLDARLRGHPCEVLGPEAGVQTVGKTVRYPDALISCEKAENAAYLIPGVVVVFEVLSPTSGRMDRIVKVREYAAIPSVRRYVIVESSSIGLTVMERADAGDPWTTSVLTEGETLPLPELGIEIPIAEFYADIDFNRA